MAIVIIRTLFIQSTSLFLLQRTGIMAFRSLGYYKAYPVWGYERFLLAINPHHFRTHNSWQVSFHSHFLLGFNSRVSHNTVSNLQCSLWKWMKSYQKGKTTIFQVLTLSAVSITELSISHIGRGRFGFVVGWSLFCVWLGFQV